MTRFQRNLVQRNLVRRNLIQRNLALIVTLAGLLGAGMTAGLGAGTAGGGFTITSPEFKAGAPLPAGAAYNAQGCQGRNESPALAWTAPPAGARALALFVHDPDAKVPGGWWHWLVVNLPANGRGLPALAGAPKGPALPLGAVQTLTSFGAPGYGGPCPPVGSGPHHYHFTLYALKALVKPEAKDSPAKVLAQVQALSLAKTDLIGTFAR